MWVESVSPTNLSYQEGTPRLDFVSRLSHRKLFDRNEMAAPYDDEKISAHDAAQVSEHHRKAGGIAATMSPERRQRVEKTLKRKLDVRCSLFVLIYIMNCKPSYSSN
jgi:hypothetical protein